MTRISPAAERALLARLLAESEPAPQARQKAPRKPQGARKAQTLPDIPPPPLIVTVAGLPPSVNHMYAPDATPVRQTGAAPKPPGKARGDGHTRHCVECGAIVGKGRKALTCAVCDLVAALRAHGPDLPAPQREERFHDTRRWRFDLSFVSALLAVEVDGGTWRAGGGRHGTDEDRDKLNHAAALGWRVMRFSPQQIERNPAGCVALIRQGLEVNP